MTGVSKTSLFIFCSFRTVLLALTARFWQVNDHRKMQELTKNQSKTTRSRNLKGQIFSSPDLVAHVYIYMPITSFDGPLLGFEKSRSRGKDEKLRQEKATMRTKTKHWNVKKPTPSVCVCFFFHFSIKLREIDILTGFCPTDWGYGHIYIYIYACMLWSYYLVQVWPFEGSLSGPRWGHYLFPSLFLNPFSEWFQEILRNTQLSFCFYFFAQLSRNFLKIAFFKKGCKNWVFQFSLFKFICWKFSFYVG